MLDGIFMKKITASPISRRGCTKKKSRKHKQLFPMITATMRKLTAAMKIVHDGNENYSRRDNPSVAYDARRHFYQKTHFSPISRSGCTKRKIKETQTAFSDDYRDNEKTHGGNRNYSRRDNPSVIYDPRWDFYQKTHFSTISRRGCTKRKIKET
jgi:hypothetical protein